MIIPLKQGMSVVPTGIGWCYINFLTVEEVDYVMREVEGLLPRVGRIVGVCKGVDGCKVYRVVVVMTRVTEQSVKFLVCRLCYGEFSEQVQVLPFPEWGWNASMASASLLNALGDIVSMDGDCFFGDTALLGDLS